VSHAKTAEPIEMPFGLRTRVEPINNVLDGVHIPPREGGGRGGPFVCPKTAEPIDIPFGLRTEVGPRNHALDGGPDPLMGRGSLRREGRPIVNYKDRCPERCING